MGVRNELYSKNILRIKEKRNPMGAISKKLNRTLQDEQNRIRSEYAKRTGSWFYLGERAAGLKTQWKKKIRKVTEDY